MTVVVDDLGTSMSVGSPATRVVSIVPSLTETLERSAPGLLVGVTDWCTQPPDLDVARIGGTKNPDVAAICELAPDLVLANDEENRAPDIAALRAAGVAVYVTDIRTVSGALDSLARLLQACGVDRPEWLDAAARAWDAVVPALTVTAVVPIWRRPWMAIGSDTFAGDVLARLGVANALADAPDRYPRIDLAMLPPHDLVVLPDEPYAFTAEDGPEAFPGKRCALVSGRHLTWYGPSLVQAPGLLSAQLAQLS